MFTGIITELGEVTSLEQKNEGARLSVKGKAVRKDSIVGDSISINGVCLTVAAIQQDVLTFDVSYETLRSTNLATLRRGDRVNLEPSLKPHSKLGGHFVTGHVDATGTIQSKTPMGNAVRVQVKIPEVISKYIVEKGSIAVDGISLTVVDVSVESMSVVIIPHTAQVTTIGLKKKGDTVNLESDILAKYVARLLHRDDTASEPGTRQSGEKTPAEDPLLSSLKRSGFIS